MAMTRQEIRQWNNDPDRCTWIPDPKNEVEEFIDRFMLHSAEKFTTNDKITDKQYDTMQLVRSHYKNGYCWHFAHMLKDTFERGEVCWAAPRPHTVWVDTDGTPYDIEGHFYDDSVAYFIPEKYLGKFKNCFKHISNEKDSAQIMYKKDIIRVMKKYCIYKHIKYDTSKESYI